MAFVASIHSKFPQRIRVIYSWSQSMVELLRKIIVLIDFTESGSGNPRWLTINAGEIIRAHDLVPQHPWVGSNGSEFDSSGNTI
jgi:hypothetical protein